MRSDDLIKEAERVMVICNACRYCEGYCAVFPAMELRRTFSGQDLKYLANLCHNCRDCYYACQYAPPHPFDLNVPKAFSALRLETYAEFARPGFLSGLFRKNGLTVALVTGFSILVVLLFTLFGTGASAVFSPHPGENGFYAVIPYAWIVFPFSALGLLAVYYLLKGLMVFWRETGGKPRELLDPAVHLRALGDAARLRYLDGGGQGCNYPDERFSFTRKWFHHFTFYGFFLTFAATTIAAFYDHFLHLPAPYPFFSLPVLFGTVGGIGIIIGTIGLLYLKARMDRSPVGPDTVGMDVAFLLLLLLTSVTGFLVLAFRDTAGMGILLIVHLGFVAGLFITLPYGKFVHAVYRYAALVRNAIEQAGK